MIINSYDDFLVRSFKARNAYEKKSAELYMELCVLQAACEHVKTHRGENDDIICDHCGKYLPPTSTEKQP